MARIKLGTQTCLYLGDLDAKRDWGHARDFVEAQWLMLQQDKPEDYVIATGIQHSVRDFVNESAKVLGMEIRWEGEDEEEIGFHDDKPIVKVDPRYYRPAEVGTLLGDPSKAKNELGWAPKTSFKELVEEMTESDLASAKKELG